MYKKADVGISKQRITIVSVLLKKYVSEINSLVNVGEVGLRNSTVKGPYVVVKLLISTIEYGG